MEIKLGIIFVIYTELLSSAVSANVKYIRYSKRNGQFSTKRKSCGVRIADNKYVAGKMPLGNESEICQGLERHWLLDKRYDDGYFYMEKEKVVEIFKPPIPVLRNFWTLPTPFEAGASIIIFITTPVSWIRFDINLYDTTKDDILRSPELSYPIMQHLYFRTDFDNAGVDTYTPDGGWKNIGYTTEPCPVKNGFIHNITLESHTGFIRTVIDGLSYFDLQYIIPPMRTTTLEIVEIGPVLTKPLLIHNITMNGPV